MRLAIAQLLTCDHIHLLDGWQRSRGATIEARLAADLGMSRVYLNAEPADVFHGKHIHAEPTEGAPEPVAHHPV
jgi:hypothetical protein